MAKTVTMSDIADRLDVSTVTVSKALSDQKGVSEEMREKIKQLANELGYRKPTGKGKDRLRSFNIGVIAPQGSMDGQESLYKEMYHKISEEADKNNCNILLEEISAKDEISGMPPKLLKENKIESLIILGRTRREYLQMIRRHYSVPMVCVEFQESANKEDGISSAKFSLTTYAVNMTEMAETGVNVLLSKMNSVRER